MISRCNICGKTKKMTEDHVPPQCCKNTGNIRYYQLFEQFISEPQDNWVYKRRNKPRIYQNGAHFHTLCDTCNNQKLGKWYDPSLGEFTNSVDEALGRIDSSSLEFSVVGKINRICRSVLGHLLAAYPSYNDTSPIDCKMRDFFKDQTQKSIDDVYLYYWIHPYNTIAIARNIGIALDPVLNGSIISVLKFPPLAFMLSQKPIIDDLPNLLDFTTMDIDSESDLPFNIRNIVRYDSEIRTANWPFVQTDNRVFVTTDDVKQASVFSFCEGIK